MEYDGVMDAWFWANFVAAFHHRLVTPPPATTGVEASSVRESPQNFLKPGKDLSNLPRYSRIFVHLFFTLENACLGAGFPNIFMGVSGVFWPLICRKTLFHPGQIASNHVPFLPEWYFEVGKVPYFFIGNSSSGWWFQMFCMFNLTWGNNPIWRSYVSSGLVQPPTSLPRMQNSTSMTVEGRVIIRRPNPSQPAEVARWDPKFAPKWVWVCR